MLELGLTGVLVLGVLIIALAKYLLQPKHKLPPGPRGLPVIGNVFQLVKDGHLKMAKWADQYGKIYRLQLGSSMAVIINDFKLAKEVMNDLNFSARPACEAIELLTGGPYGILTTSGKAWEEQRRWSLRTLRDFGFGKTSMEGIIMEEVIELTEIIKSFKEAPVKISTSMDLAVLNSLWTLINGKRSNQTDPRIKEVLVTHHRALEHMAQSGLIFAPWLKYIFPGSMKALQHAADKLMDFCRNAVAEHWNTFEAGECRDFIDAYIAEIKTTTDATSPFYGGLGRKNLEGIVSDLLQAGLETTSNTMTWLLCYITEYPEVQRKLHREIDQVVGKSGQVGLADKAKLPYVEATILETLRYSSLVSLGVQHCPMDDAEVDGYFIPKGCWVFPNMYYIHHNPEIWGDPENFRPERFLSQDGTKVVRNEALIPFQIGRRQCMGETLAKDTLFLFTANLCQQFEIERVEKEKPKWESGGLMVIPKKYHFIFKAK